SGDVSGSNDIGGLVGVNTNAKVRNSFASGGVTGDGSNIGGLIGFSSLSSVRNSYARGPVVGRDGVGGLIGRNNGQVANSYAAGSVEGRGLVGGVVGIVVEGTQAGTFTAADHPAPYGAEQVELTALTGTSSGWIPARLPSIDLLNYFCDSNRNGFIDPQERATSNYVWHFGANSYPALNCAAEMK
ncbi:MAG: GLUG motif-containing protein, partial [Gammaproteobacteria bacterium]